MAIDPAFGLNDFGKPKMYSETQTLANNILTVLFGKPGSFPSMPELGMNIQNTLYNHYDDFDEESVKSELTDQCSYFSDVISSGEFDIIKSSTTDKDGLEKPLILFIIPTVIKDVSNRLAVGIVIGDNGITYNFAWLDE